MIGRKKRRSLRDVLYDSWWDIRLCIDDFINERRTYWHDRKVRKYLWDPYHVSSSSENYGLDVFISFITCLGLFAAGLIGFYIYDTHKHPKKLIQKEISKTPTCVGPLEKNVVGNEFPGKSYEINGERVYLEIDGKSIEDYIRKISQ